MYQIFVVEDELLIRQNIRGIIEKMPGPYVFCGEASDGEMALSMMQDLMPDILLTDIRMPFLDGFGLIRNVKAMMPWLKVIIISGYGEFESAQKAIELGVDLYLLKPIRAQELARMIEKVASQLDEERSRAALPGGYDSDEVQTALRRHFMQLLFSGSEDTAGLLERAAKLKLDIVFPFYQPVLFAFEGEDVDHGRLERLLTGLLEPRTPLYELQSGGPLTVLLCGGDAGSLNEEAYRFLNILRHEVRPLCALVTVVIGTAVKRLGAIPSACRTARSLLKKAGGMAPGTVIDAGDTAQLTAEIVQSTGPFDEDFQRRLRRADPQEIPALVNEILDDPEKDALFTGALKRYYALIDLFKIAVSMITRSSSGSDTRETVEALSAEFDLLAASEKRESFRRMAAALMQRAAGSRPEPPLQLQRNPVVDRALSYVRENFCDPNISMIGVAAHVGMSSAHFSTVFSQTVGTTFIAYLTGLRIDRARELLSGTDEKLSNIALQIGYNEPNYFSHVFRKAVGMTPKEYRSRSRQA